MLMVIKRNLEKDKRALLLLFLVFCPLCANAQRDLIILRDGSERKVKIIMVKNDNTVFAADKKSSVEESISNKNIYMIKYDKRGNVFFTEDGERITGTGEAKIPSNATAIYMLKGEEIICYNVEMDADKVSFTKTKKEGKDVSTINKSEIFLIVYPDETRELLNDFATIRRMREEALAEKKRQEEEARLAELRSRYPKDATIKTVKNVTINVSLLSETEEFVTYKKLGQKNSPIFHMNRTNIEELLFNE